MYDITERMVIARSKARDTTPIHWALNRDDLMTVRRNNHAPATTETGDLRALEFLGLPVGPSGEDASYLVVRDGRGRRRIDL